MKQKIITLVIVLLLSLSLGVQNTLAHTMGSSNFVIDGANFDSGGGNSASSNYSLSNTSGENYLDFAQSSNFINNPGLVPSTPAPTPTTAPGSTSSSSSSSSSTSSTSSVSSSSTSPSTSTSTTSITNSPTAVPTASPVAFVPVAPEEEVPTAPSQLFDIALIIDDQLIEDSRTLAARVTFTSFGTEDTPVDMEFIILDASGKELYRIAGKTIIQTEGVYNQKFLDLVIPAGKYTLLLKTSYGGGVQDEFRQPFEVRNSACTGLTCVSCTYVWWIIPLELIAIAILLWRRRRRKEGEHHA